MDQNHSSQTTKRIVSAIAGLLFVSTVAFAIEPCCGVTRFDAATGLVTAVDTRTDQQFQFRVDPVEPVGIGARFEANLSAKTATLGGKTYAVINVARLAKPIEPCCNITAIDTTTRLITARNAATGQVFQFKVKPGEVSGFQIGQAVSADFARKTATVLAGQYPISSIQSAAAGAAKKFLSDPCCAIRSINTKTGVVSVLDKSSGKTYRVKVTDRALLGQLEVGRQLFSTAARDAFSVDGIAPCCG